MPISPSSINKLVPPDEKNGRLMPVFGMVFVTTAMFSTACSATCTTKPTTSRAPKRSGAWAASVMPRHSSRANNTITAQAPTKPSSSHKMEKMKSFCGSGTIAIEAAMIAQRRAPGLLRRFDAEKWTCFDKAVWQQAREDALCMADATARFDIVGSDIDPECVKLSISNAHKAGVAGTVFFEQADATKRDYSGSGILFANPPYGERLLDQKQAEQLYTALGRAAKNSPMKQYILSSDPLFERCYGRPADKRRKLYNGMIKCELHMYFKNAPRMPREKV